MKKLQLFSLLLMLACFVPQAARAEYYGIKVGGVSVTSDNCNNITGEYITPNNEEDDYYVRYEPSTKTLTLHNICIKRKGSDNRAILNESCNGLTIVFEEKNELWAINSSPVRLNANTTITSSSGIYGEQQYIRGGYEDALTVGNEAKLYINNINLKVESDWYSLNPSSIDRSKYVGLGIVGNTLFEELYITNSYVKCGGETGLLHFQKLSIDNSALDVVGPQNHLAFWDIKDLVLNGSMIIRGYQDDAVPGDINYAPEKDCFWDSSKNDYAERVIISTYVPINSSNFPDENLRNFVVETYDLNNDSRLDFIEMMKGTSINLDSKEIASIQGIEHFHFLESLCCNNNNLTTIFNLAQLTHLQSLECQNNQITTLRLSEHPKLTKIDCSNNLITNIDFSGCPKIKDIDISENRIDGWMTDVLESLPDATGSSETHKINIGDNKPNDNVCSDEQANIAKNKGWNVTLGGVDSDGNIVYDVKIGGVDITSANANDLTVLPGVTKNDMGGYARYNPTTNTLYLNGVDIVNQNGIGININTKNTDFTIIFGQEPVNITSSGNGIDANVNTLTLTTAEDWWYSQKLNITSEVAVALNVIGNVVLDGVTRIEAIGALGHRATYINGKLYVKNDAELRIKALHDIQLPIWALDDLVLENDNIIVTPAGAYFDSKDGRLMNANGTVIWGKEVVIGKLREYQYYVAGTRISNANQHDVLGNGTVVFQEPTYDGGAGTLVLTNANIEAGSEAGIGASKALYIKLEGENTINSTTRGLESSKPAYIQGPGSLYIKGQYGIDAHLSKLFISDDAKVTAEGTTRYAIDASETTISGENTVVSMKCEPEARGTFRASTSLTLNDGLRIDEPEGAQYVDGEIKDADGNVIKDEWVTIQYTEDYGITVAGIKVTNHNMEDVLGDGTVSYNPKTSTLTLDGANITSTEANGIQTKVDGLKINLIGENNITVGDYVGMRITRATDNKPVTFLGGGSLQIKANGIGLQLYVDAILTEDVKVTAESLSDTYAGIQGRKATEGPLPSITMMGEETKLRAKGGNLGSMVSIHFLDLTHNFKIVEPKGAALIEDVGIAVEGALVTNQWVTIMKENRYLFYVADTQVTNFNQDDVLGDGTVSFDPETSTLTLNNANIECEASYAIKTEDYGPITIKLIGENYVTTSSWVGLGVMEATIEGPGSLVTTAETGILSHNGLTISNGAKVSAEGTRLNGIYGDLTVKGEETIVQMKGVECGFKGSSLTLEDDLIIGLPTGAYFGEPYIVNLDGARIMDEWIIIASEDYITGINDLKDSKDLNDSTYNLAGQRVGSGYKGIVIQGGRKLLKK
jgi:Leucine-rich repeat (LRR) protein